MNHQFKTVALAGTFDHLHSGHQKILTAVCNLGEKVFCGLTTKKMNKNKVLGRIIQPYDKRENSLKEFLRWQNVVQKVDILPLSDTFGPTLGKTEIEAIVATKKTQNNVDKINQIRAEKRLPPLQKIMIKLIPAEDKKRLSSTRIRLGQINREGQVFSQIFCHKDLTLPQSQRKHFKKPLGKLLPTCGANLAWLGFLAKKEITKKPTPMIITVGDIVTQGFLQAKTPFSLAVIDYRSRRQPLHPNFHRQLLATNPCISNTVNKPGTLSFKTFKQIQHLMPKIIFQQKSGVLEVEGEEDLTVLPIVLLAPLQSLIFYGQPDKGIVKIRVTESMKDKTYKLLKKFRPL